MRIEQEPPNHEAAWKVKLREAALKALQQREAERKRREADVLRDKDGFPEPL